MTVFTRKAIFDAAMEQSAVDSGCRPEDFSSRENVVVISKTDPRARKYLRLPFFCDLVSYGSNIVASVSPEFEEEARRYINKYTRYHCFETPNLHVLDGALRAHGMCVCFMAEYFLPEPEMVTPLPCGYEVMVLGPDGFAGFYTPEWSNALCADRRELDVLAVGAFDGGRLVGLAGCSADCEGMWQIGVDVLPDYRGRGIASALTSRLTLEILDRGKVPFYCAAWSNIASVRNALRCGFRPAWAQLTAKSVEYVSNMNK